jgi:SAM-dependent methyltransferase
MVFAHQAQRHGGFPPRGQGGCGAFAQQVRCAGGAPGPGFFAIELAKLDDFKITGLDISRTLVQIATENARKAGINIDFRLGNAAAMPFADESCVFFFFGGAVKKL